MAYAMFAYAIAIWSFVGYMVYGLLKDRRDRKRRLRERAEKQTQQ